MVWDAREVSGEYWSRNRATSASGFTKSLRIFGVANNTTVCGRIVRGISSGAEQVWSTAAAAAHKMPRHGSHAVPARQAARFCITWPGSVGGRSREPPGPLTRRTREADERPTRKCRRHARNAIAPQLRRDATPALGESE